MARLLNIRCGEQPKSNDEEQRHQHFGKGRHVEVHRKNDPNPTAWTGRGPSRRRAYCKCTSTVLVLPTDFECYECYEYYRTVVYSIFEWSAHYVLVPPPRPYLVRLYCTVHVPYSGL